MLQIMFVYGNSTWRYGVWSVAMVSCTCSIGCGR